MQLITGVLASKSSQDLLYSIAETRKDDDEREAEQVWMHSIDHKEADRLYVNSMQPKLKG